MIEVTFTRNGETVTRKIQEGATIKALFEGDSLAGITTDAAFRVNGKPSTLDTPLSNQDRVNSVPTGGRLGLQS